VGSLLAGSIIAMMSCGEGGSAPPDAAPGATLSGVGLPCMTAAPGCPGEAPLCMVPLYVSRDPHNGHGYCSKTCLRNTVSITNMNSQFVQLDTPSPSTADSVCPGGTLCAEVYSILPYPDIRPNTTYYSQWACGIRCAADRPCPTGLTCNPDFHRCAPM
jgi:hypothetical protein